MPRFCVRPVFADARSASLRENRLSRHPRAFLRKAILVGMAHTAEGRAPHARKQRMTPTRARLLLAIGLFAHPPTIMTCPGLGPARISGRAERIPPRKRPLASLPGLPPQGHPSWDGPHRGGAGSAGPLTGLCLYRGIAPLGHRGFICLR